MKSAGCEIFFPYLSLRLYGGVGAESGDECGDYRYHDIDYPFDSILLFFVHVVHGFKSSRVQEFKSLSGSRVQDFKIADFTD